MPQVIAVFGAGPGLGASVARRFGRAGYAVALVARRVEPIQALADELSAEGIEAAAFPADLADQSAAVAALDAIRARFGRVDAIYYGPVGNAAFTPARELGADDLRPLLELLALTPIALVQAALPEMVERGSGTILVTHGASAVHPMANLSGFGPAMAATRNYLYSLNAELADAGVYVGTLAVAAMIERSAVHTSFTSGEMDLGQDAGAFPIVDPDELAEILWDLTTSRDRVEVLHPAMPH